MIYKDILKELITIYYSLKIRPCNIKPLRIFSFPTYALGISVTLMMAFVPKKVSDLSVLRKMDLKFSTNVISSVIRIIECSPLLSYSCTLSLADGNEIDKIEHGSHVPVDLVRFPREDCNTYGLHANLLGLNQYACNHSQILSI